MRVVWQQCKVVFLLPQIDGRAAKPPYWSCSHSTCAPFRRNGLHVLGGIIVALTIHYWRRVSFRLITLDAKSETCSHACATTNPIGASQFVPTSEPIGYLFLFIRCRSIPFRRPQMGFPARSCSGSQPCKPTISPPHGSQRSWHQSPSTPCCPMISACAEARVVHPRGLVNRDA